MLRLSASIGRESLQFVLIATFVLTAALSLPDLSATRLFTWPWYGLGQILFLLPVLGCIFSINATTEYRIGKYFAVALLAVALGALICGNISENRWLSVPSAGPYIFGAALAWIVALWLRAAGTNQEKQFSALSTAIGIFFVGFSVCSFSLWLTKNVIPSWNHGARWSAFSIRNQHPFGHPNYVAGMIILGIPWIARLAWRDIGAKRAAWILTLLACLLILGTTGSRGAIVALAAILVCAFSLLWRRRCLTARMRNWALGSGTLLLVGLVVAEPRLLGFLRGGGWDPVAAESNTQHRAMLEAGWKLGRLRPWHGIGPGTVPLMYPRVRYAVDGGTDNVLQLHNTPIEIWVEMGVIGVFVFSLAIWAVLVRILPLWQNRSPLAAQSVEADRAAAAVSFIGYAVMACSDYQLDVPAFAAMVGCNMAVLAAAGADAPTHASRFQRLALTSIAAVAITLLAVAGWPELKARQILSRALDSLSQANYSEFHRSVRAAAEIQPRDTSYLNLLAAVGLERFQVGSDTLGVEHTTRDLDLWAWFDESLKIDPAQEFVHFNAGWLALDSNRADAWEHFAAAARLAPDKGGVYLGLGLSALAQGRTDAAARALALEVLNDPAFLTAPWWQVPEFAAIRPAVEKELRQDLEKCKASARLGSSLYSELQYTEELFQWLLDQEPGNRVAERALTPEQRTYFLRHPTAAELRVGPPLSYRRQRLGYPVLVRHPDLPPPIDIYQVQENAVAARNLRYLFLPKGWLPTTLFVRLADEALGLSTHGWQPN